MPGEYAFHCAAGAFALTGIDIDDWEPHRVPNHAGSIEAAFI